MEAEDMHIILNNSSMVPIYEQLMDQVKNAIINGELSENEALPSVRALSGKLRISALTVKKAYDRLEEEGFVVTVHGKGTYVAAADRQLALEARRKSVEDDFAAAVSKAAAVGLGREEILEIVEIILEDYPWS
jgi:GntR family transcriptional regulator